MEWFECLNGMECLNGLSLSRSRLHRNFFYAWTETVAICRAVVHSKNQDNVIQTKVIQGLWSHNLE